MSLQMEEKEARLDIDSVISYYIRSVTPESLFP